VGATNTPAVDNALSLKDASMTVGDAGSSSFNVRRNPNGRRAARRCSALPEVRPSIGGKGTITASGERARGFDGVVGAMVSETGPGAAPRRRMACTTPA